MTAKKTATPPVVDDSAATPDDVAQPDPPVVEDPWSQETAFSVALLNLLVGAAVAPHRVIQITVRAVSTTAPLDVDVVSLDRVGVRIGTRLQVPRLAEAAALVAPELLEPGE